MTKTSLNTRAKAAETYYDELKQFVRKRTGSNAIAEEVVPETWIRANALTQALPDNPKAWLYRMAGGLGSQVIPGI
ncbi:MAG: sigma factor [Marinobacter sp.]|uniref:RNA polymerase sigma factor n=1 Tax=Marinobacter sp. TaxID=50741 RepID=UPI00299E325C|nr:sigma factor [Marinobacter sp.]MDX1755275.1 sigma factor [Marinobacter sp.]